MSADAIFGAGFAGLSDRARLDRTAKELEAVVVQQLFETMRKTVPEGGLLETSAADDVFRSMLDGELSRVVADKSPFGLAEAVSRELASRVDAEDGAAVPGAPAPSATGVTPAAAPWTRRAAPAPAPAPGPAPAAAALARREWRA